MPRPKAPSAAVQPSKGSKITFGDNSDEEDDFELEQSFEAGPSQPKSRQVDSDDDDDEDRDEDDEAPEAVGVSSSQVGNDDVATAAEMLAQQSRARKEAARIRGQKIAEAKAAKVSLVKGKGKGKSVETALKKRKVREPESDSEEEEDEDDEEDDEDTKRLKKRMAAAMAQGDDEDSDMELSGSGSEEEGDEEEEGSFHTDSEDEDEDEEEEELDDAASEQLEDEGPLDDKTRQLRARMQAMMEAAEARARGDDPALVSNTKSKSKTVQPKKSALKQSQSRSSVAEEEDPDAGYDLAPLSSFGKPLSAEILRRAEEAEKAKMAKKAETEALAKSQRKKGASAKKMRKKRKVEPTTKVISANKSLHVLPPALSSDFSSNTLPPIIDPGTRVGTNSKLHKKFFKAAMGNSGVRPGMGVMDGRKRTVAK